ncbi:unnamed protein product [Echinostoma caproni]|uniref:Uncharacterized protein n=1 Tax=Echinostoma caproni TaxID=27848 RepID=A0A183BE12_9TREM|nr:unnamed protein product [Echinostoma caproni]
MSPIPPPSRSSGSSDDPANSKTSDGNSAAVLSCPTSNAVQFSSNPPPAEALLRPRCPFKLATLNVDTDAYRTTGRFSSYARDPSHR